MRDVFNAPAILLIGNDPTEQHPLLAWQIRNNVRLHRPRLYVINSESTSSCAGRRRASRRFQREPKVKSAAFLAGDDSAAEALGGQNREAWMALRDKLRGEQNLVIIFGSEIRGAADCVAGEFRVGDSQARS